MRQSSSITEFAIHPNSSEKVLRFAHLSKSSKSNNLDSEAAGPIIQVAETVNPFSESNQDTVYDEACHSHGIMNYVKHQVSKYTNCQVHI